MNILTLQELQAVGAIAPNSIVNADCLEAMKLIPDKSIDAIICDLPYGVTACKWDVVIPFDLLWEQYKRIIKPNGAIALFGSQPFTSALVMSNPTWFKHNWIWKKNVSGNFQLGRHQPIKITEDVLIFANGGFTYNAKNKCTYNPVMVKRDKKLKQRREHGRSKHLNGINYRLNPSRIKTDKTDKVYKLPTNIIDLPKTGVNLHPTQKPVALIEYLIKTYTKEGELILDNTAGSGTLAIAAINTNRQYICIEKDEHYFEVMRDRVANHDPNAPIKTKKPKAAPKGQLALF